MLKIHSSYSLRKNTTFGVDIASTYFAQPKNSEQVRYALGKAKEQNWKIQIIGEGSNLLFAGMYEGLVIHPLILGIEIIDESESEILLRCGSGENWDDLVAYCVGKEWFGLENLSLIPGSVGASAVQNIGAYGVEAKDIIEFVEVLDTVSGEKAIINNADCAFGYRDSIFKHGSKQKYIVTHIVFRLRKKGELKLDYGNVEKEFEKQKEHDIHTLRQTIISIRESKLPDPKLFGNAGSFFKNPVISREQFTDLKKDNPDIPGFSSKALHTKVPAAWLIENSGWKGKREGDVGTWPKQPLVIVNYGNASGREIVDFSEKIRLSVKKKFDIVLEHEVTII